MHSVHLLLNRNQHHNSLDNKMFCCTDLQVSWQNRFRWVCLMMEKLTVIKNKMPLRYVVFRVIKMQKGFKKNAVSIKFKHMKKQTNLPGWLTALLALAKTGFFSWSVLLPLCYTELYDADRSGGFKKNGAKPAQHTLKFISNKKSVTPVISSCKHFKCLPFAEILNQRQTASCLAPVKCLLRKSALI